MKADPKKVMEGMAIAALAVNAEEMYLYLPEKEAEYAKELETEAAGVRHPDPDRDRQSQSKPRRCIPPYFDHGCVGRYFRRQL